MRINPEQIYQWVFVDACTKCTDNAGNAYVARARRSIRNRIGIEHRPAIVARRGRFGDWKGVRAAVSLPLT